MHRRRGQATNNRINATNNSASCTRILLVISGIILFLLVPVILKIGVIIIGVLSFFFCCFPSTGGTGGQRNRAPQARRGPRWGVLGDRSNRKSIKDIITFKKRPPVLDGEKFVFNFDRIPKHRNGEYVHGVGEALEFKIFPRDQYGKEWDIEKLQDDDIEVAVTGVEELLPFTKNDTDTKSVVSSFTVQKVGVYYVYVYVKNVLVKSNFPMKITFSSTLAPKNFRLQTNLKTTIFKQFSEFMFELTMIDKFGNLTLQPFNYTHFSVVFVENGKKVKVGPRVVDLYFIRDTKLGVKEFVLTFKECGHFQFELVYDSKVLYSESVCVLEKEEFEYYSNFVSKKSSYSSELGVDLLSYYEYGNPKKMTTKKHKKAYCYIRPHVITFKRSWGWFFSSKVCSIDIKKCSFKLIKKKLVVQYPSKKMICYLDSKNYLLIYALMVHLKNVVVVDEKELIYRVKSILEFGSVEPSRNRQLLFSIYTHEKGKETLQLNFTELVKKTARQLPRTKDLQELTTQENLEGFVFGVMNWFFGLTRNVRLYLQNDPVLVQEISNEFSMYMSEKLNDRSFPNVYFVVKYLFNSIDKQQGNADDLKITKTIRLLSYFNEKDLVADYFKHLLGRSLLFERNEKSFGTEKVFEIRKFIMKLKQMFGIQFAKKMQSMLKDIKISSQMPQSKRQNGIKLNPLVLTSSVWPIKMNHENAFILSSPELSNSLKEFENWYCTTYRGRKLTWLFHERFCTCEVKALFVRGDYFLKLTTLQAQVLLFFNSKVNFENGLNFDEVVELLEIQNHPLLKSLMKIFCKIKLLSHKNKKFKVNESFGTNRKRLNLCKFKQKLTKEQEVIKSNYFKNRLVIVEAAVVRLMKSKKVYSHENLFKATQKQVSKYFPLKMKFFKERIEALVVKEFIQRDEKNRRVYQYVS